MAYETLLYSAADGIATITVNRPDKLNALNARVIAELGEAIDTAREDGSVGGVILTGAGRAFVAGAEALSCLVSCRPRHSTIPT